MIRFADMCLLCFCNITAPLSGPLVLAETLGKRKGSAKSNKMKDQVEKDRYLLKRRDEPVNLKVHQVGPAQAGSSDQSVHLDGSSLAGKDVSPSADDHLPDASGSTLIESFKQPSSQAANVEELHGERQAEHGGTDVVRPSDKVKVRKRSGGEVSGGSSPSTERKKKKKKVVLGLNTDSNHVAGQAAVSSDNVVMEKVARESVQVPSASREELQMDIEQKGEPTDSSVSDPVLDKVGIRSNDIDLRQLLSDLHAIALDPFFGAESCNINAIRELFLKFRSLVYQKSLALSATVESESSTPVSKLPVAAPMSDTGPSNNVKQTSNLKPQKNSARPDDPAIKGGRKRGTSDRQEEMAAKKKKKINDLRALAAQKKASGKTSEVQSGENKDIPARKLVSTPVKSSKPDSAKKKDPAEKVPDPTMLVMKFPHNGSLPSISELKAKFARFGALDHSATRVFWKSSTCRLVYQYRDHAVQAFRFATGSTNLFGNTNVRCYIREVAAEAQDAETTKDTSAGTSAPKDGAADSRSSAKPGQLKSCLKKPPGEEGLTTDGGNGSNRGTPRVKFMLGAEDNNRDRSEQMNDIKNVNNTSSIADGSASSSSNINNYTSQSSMLPLPTTAQYANAPNDIHFAHQVALRNVPHYNNQVSLSEPDISQPMLALLTKCSDIVTNLTNLLGYFPYHGI